jgi:hypothetical protein
VPLLPVGQEEEPTLPLLKPFSTKPSGVGSAPPGTRTPNPGIKRTRPMPCRSVVTLVASVPVSVGTGMCGWAGLYGWLYMP